MSGVVWGLRSLAADLAETDLTGYAAQLAGYAERLAAEETPEAWLEAGIKAGWVSQPFCGAHDIHPFTPAELQADRADPDYQIHDRCVTCVRVFNNTT